MRIISRRGEWYDNDFVYIFFFSSRRRHTRLQGDWSSDVCSSDLLSRHYDDLAQLWRRGEYIPMSLDEGLARAAAVGDRKSVV